MLPTLVNHTTQNTSQHTSHTQLQLTTQPHTTQPHTTLKSDVAELSHDTNSPSIN